MMQVIDDFLLDYPALRRYADVAIYRDHANGPDGVVCPLICDKLPPDVRRQVMTGMRMFKGSDVRDVTMFMRMSPAGVPCPHQAHSDEVMGEYSLMLYLNRPEHCQGGTALLRHRATRVVRGDQMDAEQWREDMNTPEAWEVTERVDMKANRAFFFDAHLLHRAEPIGGFGETSTDSRLVLTGFFS